MALSDLAWTTRAGVAAELLDHLLATHPWSPERGRIAAGAPPRPRVAALFALVATAIHRDPLLALALDPQEDVEVRRNAIWGLERLSSPISGDDLQALLHDPLLCRDPHRLFGPSDLLTLAHAPSAEAVAQQFLLTRSPEQRAELLAGSSPDRADAPQRLVEWLFRQWLEHDRHVMTGNETSNGPNRKVIRRFLARSEARGVLQELWRQASGEERRALLDDLDDPEYEWTFPAPLTPAEHEELAQALALPVAALLARFGRRGLVEQLEKSVSAESRPRSGGARRPPVSDETQRRLRVLRHWQDPQIEEWMAGHALGLRLHAGLRLQLVWRLWPRNRPLAATVLAMALRSGDRELYTPFLPWVARYPEACDRELLQEAFRPAQSIELRFFALCGLDRLDRDTSPPWVEEAAALVRDPKTEHVLRLRALGALARRGNGAALAELTDHAETEPDLLRRAEGVSILGEVAPAASLGTFDAVLVREERAPSQICAPAAEEAALALARLATPEARTVLLRAYLNASTWSVRHALEDYMTALVDTPEGETPQVSAPEMNWRRMLRIE